MWIATAIHSSGQTIFSLTHIEGITLGAGKDIQYFDRSYKHVKIYSIANITSETWINLAYAQRERVRILNLMVK